MKAAVFEMELEEDNSQGEYRTKVTVSLAGNVVWTDYVSDYRWDGNTESRAWEKFAEHLARKLR